MAHQLESTMVEQGLNVTARAREKIIETQDVGTVFKEPLTKMGSKETAPASHKYARFEMHLEEPPQ